MREMAANWESLRSEEDPRVDAEERARFVGAWNEHRQIYGYTLLAELPYALRNALHNHSDLEGVNYDLLVVDEYQDLNSCDLEVLRLIAERGCSIIAAGDDDQSIYSFRRAAPEGMRRFPRDYPGSGDYTLSVTQRCGSRIIEWATHVIEGDPDRPSGRPRLRSSDESPPGEVALLAFPGEVSEAKGICGLVHRLIQVEDVLPSDILVLFRSDHRGTFSSHVKECLDEQGIPWSDPGVVDTMLSEPGNRRMLEIVRVLVNRSDSLAWAGLLCLERGVGATFFDFIYERARARRIQFGEALLDGYADCFAGGPTTSSKRAQGLIQSVLAWVDDHDPPENCPEKGWSNWIIGSTGGDVVPAPSEELAAVLHAIDKLVEPEQGLDRYLGQISPLGRDQALAESPGVRIMTMSGAKGLTVRATIIAATEEGIIPRPDCDLGEERRLLYVAMTRAKEFLYVTWARRRRGPTARAGAPRVAIARRPSSFLDAGPASSEDGSEFIRRKWG
jgi:DNA helicase II / ATP-dependent DNA helicase PcrA